MKFYAAISKNLTSETLRFKLLDKISLLYFEMRMYLFFIILVFYWKSACN